MLFQSPKHVLANKDYDFLRHLLHFCIISNTGLKLLCSQVGCCHKKLSVMMWNDVLKLVMCKTDLIISAMLLRVCRALIKNTTK